MPRRRPPALLAALCALLLPLTVPATGQVRTTIRPGVSTAGIDLSNMTVEQAAAVLDQQLAPRLQGDMILGAAGRPWPLTMAQAQLKLDSVRTAKRALYAKAGVTAVPPAITHSRAAVRDFVERVAARVRKAPRDAAIRITLRHIFRAHSRAGRSLPVASTRAAIDAALDDPAAVRKVHVRLVRLPPRVTFANLARVYNTVITIDRNHFKLRLFKALKFRKSYPIAVGMAGLARRSGDPRRRPEQPAARALAGHRERRRDPRHRRGLVDRHARLPRLHPHACVRRDRPLPAGAGRHAGA